MPKTKANGIEIAYETHGDPAAPAILLVMGLGAQLTLWPEEFVDTLVASGFRVVRYDNRDAGLSSDFGAWGPADLPGAIQRFMAGQPVETPYTLHDMAADGTALLDALGIAQAHVLGMSMGGMIAQLIAADRPERTRSLLSVMSTSSRRGLPPGKPEAMKALLTRPEGDDRAKLVEHGMWLRRVIGSPGYPVEEAWLRSFVERNVDRRYYPQGVGRQYLAILASGDRVAALQGLRAPTLVIHGADDPVIHPDCGRDVAALVPGAELEIYPGMGHDIAPALAPVLAERVARFCRAADRRAAA